MKPSEQGMRVRNWRNKCETTKMVLRQLALRTQKDEGEKGGKDGEIRWEV